MPPFPTRAAPENLRCLLFLPRLFFRRRFLCTSLALCTTLTPPLRAIAIGRMWPRVTQHSPGRFFGEILSIHFNLRQTPPASTRRLHMPHFFFFPTKAIDQSKTTTHLAGNGASRGTSVVRLRRMDHETHETARKAKRKKTNHRSLLPGVFEKTQEV